MGLHEVTFGGVLLSPLLGFALLSIPVTLGLLVLIRKTGLTGWIWHHALFTCALYVCVLASVTFIFTSFS